MGPRPLPFHLRLISFTTSSFPFNVYFIHSCVFLSSILITSLFPSFFCYTSFICSILFYRSRPQQYLHYLLNCLDKSYVIFASFSSMLLMESSGLVLWCLLMIISSYILPYSYFYLMSRKLQLISTYLFLTIFPYIF